MRTQLQQHTITLLRKLGKKGSIPPKASAGICYNIEYVTSSSIHWIFKDYNKVVARWKYFSGSFIYPVPPSKNANVSDAVRAYGTDCWVGTYGDMRRKFARYLAREFSKRYPVK